MANDEFGDFQTPEALVREIFHVLHLDRYERLLEPTCGVGNFMRVAASLSPGLEMFGVEAQEHYASAARSFARVDTANAMTYDFAGGISWQHKGKLLVVGNPPWVTNAALTSLDSTNKPVLSNIRGLKGLDALTGASNFDIAEAIILRLVGSLAGEAPTIAMLCKTQVARNVLAYAEQYGLGVLGSQMYLIDAKRWFNAGVDACLFVLELAPGESNYISDVFDSLSSVAPSKKLGAIGGRMVSDVERYENTKAADGTSPIEWRQGIKHDATHAMELVELDGPRKKSGEIVDVEADYVFPLLKCTDVARGRTLTATKWMIVPQRHTGDDTSRLRSAAPKLWAYLEDHSELLDGRKSSIYRNRSRFCIFGVGEYSFSTFKVAISAMHKEPQFRFVGPLGGRPAVFDDVTYFTSFDEAEKAAIVTAILVSKPAQDLLESLTFTDSKRPITKKLLQRLDLAVLAELSSRGSLLKTATTIGLEAGYVFGPNDLERSLDTLLASWAGTPALY